MQTPSYSFNEFIKACEDKKAIFIAKGALLTASSDFNLSTQNRVLDFIAQRGLEKPTFIKTDPWENNKRPDINIMIDVYYFVSGSIYGYLAFCYSPITKKWLIKSFKKNHKQSVKCLSSKSVGADTDLIGGEL